MCSTTWPNPTTKNNGVFFVYKLVYNNGDCLKFRQSFFLGGEVKNINLTPKSPAYRQAGLKGT